MPRGIYERKAKRGRPAGSKNKVTLTAKHGDVDVTFTVPNEGLTLDEIQKQINVLNSKLMNYKESWCMEIARRMLDAGITQ